MWGTVAVVLILVLMASILTVIFFNEDSFSFRKSKYFKKRIAITPDWQKNMFLWLRYIILSKSYGAHLGIPDEEYSNVGVNIS